MKIGNQWQIQDSQTITIDDASQCFFQKTVSNRKKFDPGVLKQVVLLQFASVMQNFCGSQWHNQNFFFFFWEHQPRSFIILLFSTVSPETLIVVSKFLVPFSWCHICSIYLTNGITVITQLTI